MKTHLAKSLGGIAISNGKMVGAGRFELPTSWSRSTRASQTTLRPDATDAKEPAARPFVMQRRFSLLRPGGSERIRNNPIFKNGTPDAYSHVRGKRCLRIQGFAPNDNQALKPVPGAKPSFFAGIQR